MSRSNFESISGGALTGSEVVDVSSIGKYYTFLSKGILTGTQMMFLARSDFDIFLGSMSRSNFESISGGALTGSEVVDVSSIGKYYTFLSKES
jgi:hypothetical protein